MIYIQPIGGLGNIFFQIASIWTLARDNNDELSLLNIDKTIMSLNSLNRGNINYILNRFPHQIDCVNKIYHPFHYVPIEYKKEHEYMGYFQCENYFKHRRNDILKLFKPADEFNVEINKYKDLFDNISIHVRHSDYYDLSGIYSIPTIEYYKNALSYLSKDLKVLVFSDDLKWCEENFIGERFKFVNEIDYISIYIMSKMKYHIIANSSFSWWGSWMSEHNDKIVITPAKWFNNSYSDADIIPNNWIRI